MSLINNLYLFFNLFDTKKKCLYLHDLSISFNEGRINISDLVNEDRQFFSFDDSVLKSFFFLSTTNNYNQFVLR